MSSSFSKYRIIRQIGAGGMGEVFLAQDTELERHVALKIMSPELARDEIQRKRFRTEARAASGLVHPNICVIHDVGETEEGRPFLAMEYVEGWWRVIPRSLLRAGRMICARWAKLCG